jgi:hypothetical protein
MSGGISNRCFDKQRRFGASKPRHFEFKLGAAIASSFACKGARFSCAIDARGNASVLYTLAAFLASNGNLQGRSFPSQPIPGVEQLQQ